MENNKPTERKLKIAPKYFTRRWDDAVFPEIRIAGKWLQDLGFTCGKFVSVTHEENKITIAVIEEAQQEIQLAKSAGEKGKIIPLAVEDIPINQLFLAHPLSEDQNTNHCNFDTIA